MALNNQSKLLMFFSIFGLITLSHFAYAKSVAYESSDEILAKAGKYYISQEHCNKDGYNCNYVLYGAKKPQIIVKQWSHIANGYQFTSKLMGLLYGATGSGLILTLIDDQNKQRDFADVKALNKQKSCMVTFENGLKNMPDSLVFYSIPDFKVRLVLNKKVPQFSKFDDLSNANFEENGDFRFEYTYTIEKELAIQNVIIQNPCKANYRIIMD